MLFPCLSRDNILCLLIMNCSGKDNTTSSSIQRTCSMSPALFFSVTKGVQGNMKTQSFGLRLKEEKRCNRGKGRERENARLPFFCSYLEFLFVLTMCQKKNQFETINYTGQHDLSFLILASSTSKYFLCEDTKYRLHLFPLKETFCTR